jgi:serine/threonine-protein kinase
MRALALDREERFPSAASMMDALEQVQIEAAIGGNAPAEPEKEPADPDSEKVEYFYRKSVLPPPMEE